MRRPLIYAKSKYDEAQLLCKRNIGCDGIEIQLFKEFDDTESGRNFVPWSEVFNLDISKEHKIRAVHVPIQKVDMIHAETMGSDIMCDRFENICDFAENIAQQQGCSVCLVMHSEMDLSKLRSTGLYDRILCTFGMLLEKYPSIEIAVENVIPMNYFRDQKDFELRNNFAFEHTKLVRALRTDLGTDRVGTILDICHAKLSGKLLVNMMSYLDLEIQDRMFSLENYFKHNMDICKEIHMADCQGFGYKPGQHGAPLSESSKFLIESVLDCYDKFNYTCPICLEVQEKDYLVCDGYKESKRLLEEALDSRC